MKKITFWGSVASIVGLLLALLSMQANSDDTTTMGNQSPAISNTQGDVHINYGDTKIDSSKKYVLRESQGGQPRVLKSPDIRGILDPSAQVCGQVFNGTEIKPLHETATQEGYEIWRKIKILKGECAGKVGWVLSPEISYE